MIAYPQTRADPRHGVPGATALLATIAGIKLSTHLLTSSGYGYFRDELYFIDAGRHLDFGYVDFPPLVAVLAAATRIAIGESQLAIHLLPAIAGALLVLVTGLIARELGGGIFAQGVAALAALVAPTYLGIDSLFSMNPFDELWWGLAAYIVVLILKRDRTQLWALLGLVIGIGLLTKVTMAYLALAVAAGLLLTPSRRALRTPGPWVALAIAGIMSLPYVAWEIANHWPSLPFWSSYSSSADQLSPLGFFVVQLFTMNVMSAPICLLGLYFYFRSSGGRPYRVLGWVFLLLYIVFAIMHTKYYFLAPIYPVVFAAGSVMLERATRASRQLKLAYVSVLAASGLVCAVLTLPVLPPRVLAWATSPVQVAGGLGIREEGPGASKLPQPFADRFGWDTLTFAVSGVFHRLRRSDQAEACILARNYGEAGAIDLYGPGLGLPPAISGHDAYYQWGPRGCTGAVVISVGWSRKTLLGVFRSVTLETTARCAFCMLYESQVPVYVARGTRVPFREAWPRFKLFYAEWTS